MQIQISGRKEAGQIQTSWRGAGQTELAVQTGAPLSFWTLKGKRKEEKQHSETARKRAWGKLFTQYLFSGEFPRNCNQDVGYWVSLATHTAPLRNPELARARDSLSGMWVLSEAVSKKGCLGFSQCWEIIIKKPLQHRTPKNTLQGRSLADRQKQREDGGGCVRQTDDGHAHTVV